MDRKALAVIALSMAANAHAADPARVDIEVGGEPFAVFVDGDAASVVAVPAAARLGLLPMAVGPDCAFVNRTLSPFGRIISACAAGSSSPTCRVMSDLIDRVRFDTGTAGASRLLQSWHVVTRVSDPLDPDETLATARAASGVSSVQLVVEPTPTGTPGAATVSVNAGGASWASVLSGWVDLSAPGATFDASTGSWNTQDNILACGILAGEATLGWAQGVELSPHGSPLSAADLVELYHLLAANEPVSGGTGVQQAVQLGAQIGVALTSMGLPSSAVAAATRFAFAHLYASPAELLPFDDGALRALASAGISRPMVEWSAAFEP